MVQSLNHIRCLLNHDPYEATPIRESCGLNICLSIDQLIDQPSALPDPAQSPPETAC